MRNFHTRSTCCVNLVTSVVSFSHCQFVELPCYVLGSSGICVPICINPVGVSDEVGLLPLFMIIIIPMPAGPCTSGMELITDLALWIVPFMLLLLLLWRLLLALLVFAATSASRRRRGAIATAAPSVPSPATSSVAVLPTPSVYGVCRRTKT